MAESGIIMYGTNWCPDCHRARHFFDQHQIAYTWVNIDKDPVAEQQVRQLNHGYRSVPTIVFPDDSTLVEPSISQLENKLLKV